MPERLRLVLPHSVMLLVSLALFWAALQIDTSGTGGRIGPDFWPKVVIGSMGLLCLYEIVKRLFVRGSVDATGLTGDLERSPAEAVDPTVASAPVPEPEYPRLLWTGVALIVGYVVVVPWLGFFITTALFLTAFIWLGGYRRPLVALAVSTIGAFVLVVIFMRIAYISLPLGEGPFRLVSTTLLSLIGVK